MAKEITLEIRERIINAYLNQISNKEICNIFGCSISTVKRIITRYLGDGLITSKPRGGIKTKKLLAIHQEKIKDYIIDNPSITLKDISRKLNSEFNITISKSTIDRSISSFSFSLKRLSLVPEKRNDIDTINIRYQYALEFYSLVSSNDGNNLFFLDEVGFSVSMRSRNGRSLIGTSAFLKVPKLRSRNISICCVISKNGTFLYEKQTRAFNTETFMQFIEKLLLKFDEMNLLNMIIIMDNVPFHHSLIIKNKIEERGHRVIYLPPYSPFLNPIENMFAQWKQLVRGSNPANETELINLIDQKFNLISEVQCDNYYRHMFLNLHKCILKEEIYDN